MSEILLEMWSTENFEKEKFVKSIYNAISLLKSYFHGNESKFSYFSYCELPRPKFYVKSIWLI